MAVSIADLFVTVGADVTAAISGLNSVSTQLNKTANSFQSAVPAALALTTAAGTIGAGFLSAVKTAATFDQAMSGVRAVMSPSEIDQFGGALDALALSLGAKTTFNAMQTAGAIEELLKLGVSAPAILDGAAQAAVSLAAATGAPLGDAATVAAQALNAFHLSVGDLPGVVDVLAGVINVTAADLNDIKLGFSDVAAVAHGMGLSLTDTAVTLGIFRDNALTGNTAGTALKTMLVGLQPTTKQQKNLFDQLGLTVGGTANAFFDAQGNIKDMAQISGVLNNALGGMTKQQRAATLETLFGTQGMLAANIIMDTGADGIRKYTAEVKNIKAADQAAERLNNLLGDVEKLSGALQSASIAIGNFFDPALRQITQRVTEVVNAFNDMNPQAQKLVAAIVGIAGAVAGGIGGLVLLGATVKFLAPSFLAVGRVLLSLVPLFRIVAVVAAVLAAAWATNLFGIQEKVQAAFEAIPGILDRVAAAFAGVGDFWAANVVPALFTITNMIERHVIPIFNALASGPLGNLGEVFKQIFAGDIKGAVGTFLAIIGALVPGLSRITADVLNALASGPLGNLGLVFQKVFSGDISGAVDTFIAIIGALVPGLGGIIQNVRSTIGNIVKFLSPILTNLGVIFDKIFKGDIAGALDTFRAIIVAVIPPVGRLFQVLEEFAGFVGPKLGAAFQVVAGFIQNEVIPRFIALAEFVLPLLQQGAARVGEVWSTVLAPAFERVASFVATEVIPRLGPLVDTLLPALQGASAALSEVWLTKLGPAFQAVGTFLAGEVLPRLQPLADNIMPALQSASQTIATVWSEQLAPAFQTVSDTVGGALGGALGTLGRIMDILVSGNGQLLIDFLKASLPQALQDLGRQIESLGPLLGAAGGFFGALFNVMGSLASLGSTALQGLFQNVLVPGFQKLGEVIAPAAPAFEAVGNALGPMASNLGLIGDKLEPVTKFLLDAKVALDDFALAIQNFKLPPWLTPTNPASLFGGPAGGGNGTIKSAFIPAGGFASASDSGGGGQVIIQGDVNIGSEVDADNFLNRMAELIGSSARRVTAPPDNSAFPAIHALSA